MDSSEFGLMVIELEEAIRVFIDKLKYEEK